MQIVVAGKIICCHFLCFEKMPYVCPGIVSAHFAITVAVDGLFVIFKLLCCELYPELIAGRLDAAGSKPVVAMLAGCADETPFRKWDAEFFFVGQAYRMARYFVDRGVARAVMAGGVKRAGLLKNLMPLKTIAHQSR
jgi:hypothetical protein